MPVNFASALLRFQGHLALKLLLLYSSIGRVADLSVMSKESFYALA